MNETMGENVPNSQKERPNSYMLPQGDREEVLRLSRLRKFSSFSVREEGAASTSSSSRLSSLQASPVRRAPITNNTNSNLDFRVKELERLLSEKVT